MTFVGKVLVTTAALVLAGSTTATANAAGPDTAAAQAPGGCFLGLVCGALDNRTNHAVYVAWADDDSGFDYAWVAPGTKKGGRWNDGIDVDYFFVETGCQATTNGWITWYDPGWYKITDDQTVTLNGYSC
ncbi:MULTISPECIES: hypothetical protein [unclassified Amycolatopsis]|uniref:hypothetical protein n=1 Tax=unclassified Amycolatopsis TaxID=2618356 RepID=UPI00287504A5|nr:MULTISPECIES: hypothetical protein [unclassified Amycolatopsis]MDS0140123.1 hypothetical protein [Amycolatopsis sp. 505]MDS0148677.1 hypothetical protein [Amycolatopsis sp. CM201R]